MKPEEIEKQIVDAPETKLPDAWRSEILAAARAAQEAAMPAAPNNTGAALWIWRELVQPLRHSWAALAALWIILIGAQMLTSDPGATSESPSASNSQMAHPSQQELQEQRLLLSELLNSNDNQESDQKKAPTRPRSQAQSQLGAA